MATWPWLLIMDNILVIGSIALFLSTKERSLIVVSAILTLLTIVTNILTIIGYNNWFILSIPIIFLFIVGIFGRFFVKSKFIHVSSPLAWIVIIIVLIIVLTGLVFVITVKPK